MILVASLFDRVVTVRFAHSKHREQIVGKSLLFVLDALLRKERRRLQDIKGAVAILGEAPFTSMRQVVTALNTIAFVLKIRIVVVQAKGEDRDQLIAKGLKLLQTHKAGALIKPLYSGPPNITKSRSL